MITYNQFRPTAYDTKGLGLPDQQDWIVLEVGRTRDSITYEESNFAVAQTILDEAKAEYEVHRFGHWGPGWFEIILVHPDHSDAVNKIHRALVNYPILSDDDYSERQWNAAAAYWTTLGTSERVRLSKKYRFHLMACRRNELPTDATGELVSYLADGC